MQKKQTISSALTVIIAIYHTVYFWLLFMFFIAVVIVKPAAISPAAATATQDLPILWSTFKPLRSFFMDNSRKYFLVSTTIFKLSYDTGK